MGVRQKTTVFPTGEFADIFFGQERRWLAVVATLATALIYAALPSNLSVGPRWLLLAVMVAVVLPTLISHRVGHITPPARCWGI